MSKLASSWQQVLNTTTPLLFIATTIPCYSQNATPVKDSLLDKIYSLQCKGDRFFQDGLFVSKRFKGKGRDLRNDNNIFFTALITYTLQSIRNGFIQSDKQRIDSIASRAKSNYARYLNRHNDITYNFWQTNPERPWPNSRFWSKKKRLRLPDDFDDTSIIFLTKAKNDSIDSLLKLKMAQHTNANKKIRSTFRRYKDYTAYNTWFGKKMKQDFDICVMSNTLLYIFQRRFQLNQFDYETIHLIEQMVHNNDHIKHPQIISSNYPNTSIILYHLARLIAEANNEVSMAFRTKVVNDLYEKLRHTTNRMEKIILTSSLYRLNEKVEFQIDFNNIEKDFESFTFFVANPLSGSSLFIKRLLGKSKFLHFNFRSDVYYLALILELQVLSAKEYEKS